MIRELQIEDLSNGFFETLQALAPVQLTATQMLDIFSSRMDHIKTFVVIDNEKVIATASLMLEKKYTHGGVTAGYIEDVAVHESHQGKGIGSKLIEYVLDYAKNIGCYKVVLCCKDHLIPFYEKAGFRKMDHILKVYNTL